MTNTGRWDDPLTEAMEDYKRVGRDFMGVFDYHMTRGWVINVPYLFAMGSFYEDGGKTVCHVEYLRGSVADLFRYGLNLDIDFVEFERNCNGRTKRYSLERLGRLVT